MSDVATEARLLAADLAPGDTLRNQVCPSCGGGNTRETSFSVTRQHLGVLWNCYRASCGERGFAGTAGALAQPAWEPKKMRPYTGTLEKPLVSDRRYFFERFGLDGQVSDAYIRVNDRDEYVLPVGDLNGYVRGYVVRQPAWKGDPEPPRTGIIGRPKALTYFHVDAPLQALYRPGRQLSDALVVVEDQISAMKIAQEGVTAVALLGTHVNAERVREWSQLRPREVVIALDPDATAAAIQIARTWGLAFDKMRVALLSEDPKDTDNADLLPELGL